MKKIIALAVATVALSGSAFAQLNSPQTGNNTATSTAAVTGTVQVPISIENLRGLDMGELNRNTPSVTGWDGGGNPYNLNNTAKFEVLGDAGDNVLFTFEGPITLTLDNPNDL